MNLEYFDKLKVKVSHDPDLSTNQLSWEEGHMI